MHCPKCHSAMDQIHFEAIEVDRCTGCEGLWFDPMEDRDLRGRDGVDRLDVGDPQKGAEFDAKAVVDCPRCSVRMVRMVDHQHPHIWYESCPICFGSFFDAGEFKDLKQKTIADLFKGRKRRKRPLH